MKQASQVTGLKTLQHELLVTGLPIWKTNKPLIFLLWF